MDSLSFPIFTPNEKKFRLTPNWIVYGLWFISIGFFWLFDGLTFVESIKTFWLITVLVVSMYFLFVSFFQYRPLNGVIDGEIFFTGSGITVNEKVYDLKSITKLDFGFVDYYGENSLLGKGDFNPKLYQGVNNFVSFVVTATGETQKIYFKLCAKNEYMLLYTFINDAVKAGSMSYLRAIDLIDVENVVKPEYAN